jgi:hypothetical protein
MNQRKTCRTAEDAGQQLSGSPLLILVFIFYQLFYSRSKSFKWFLL